MSLIKFEIVKLLRSPAVFGFLAACLILNTIVIFSSSYKQNIDYMNEVAEITGNIYGTEYKEKLQTVLVPEESDYLKRDIYDKIVEAAENSENVFAKLDTNKMIETIQDSEETYAGITLQIQQWKYNLLAPVIDIKAKEQDGDSVYFAMQSNYIHETVFSIIGGVLALECGIFFVLIMLWALGFENMVRTELVTYSTKTGRKLIFNKTVAALLIGTVFFIIIYIFGYGLTFLINDFSLVWGQNISAQYHMVYDNVLSIIGDIPFITWTSMTIGEYFFACVGIAFLNCLVMALFTVPFGLLIRNVYAAFCAIAGITFLHFVFYIYCLQTLRKMPFIWNLSLIAPLTQILNNGLWFSDGGIRMLLPRFETVYPLICMVLICPVLIISIQKFNRKEIV